MVINKKIEKELTYCSYDSSNIIASCYNEKTNELTLTFKKGDQYHYEAVMFDEYKMFETAKSQGKILRSSVDGKKYTKGDSVDVAALLLEIKTVSTTGVLVKTEFDKDEVQLITFMENFLLKTQNKVDLKLSELKDVEYFLQKVIKNKENE